MRGLVTDPIQGSPSSEAAVVLVAARNDSMQRFLALLLRGTRAAVEFADTSQSIVEALGDERLRVLVVVTERSGWPGLEVAETARCAQAQTVFVGHEAPGPGWQFVHGVVKLPFATGDLAGCVVSALEDRGRTGASGSG